ncbi:hypothetical protein V6N12_047526 [Hibiscus sabdariffa]|uniref:Uncharacterized protein n=1 Tax=Hibiscus sabdariffa TaxID=183260 RepID=A0ABR2DB44_9ROSI
MVSHKTHMEKAAIKSVVGSNRPGDDVVIGSREFKGVGLENEGIAVGEKEGLGLGFESGELNSAETTGLPVVAVGGYFDGEDGAGAELGFEKVQEVSGYDGLGNVGHSQCGSLNLHRQSPVATRHSAGFCFAEF